MFRFFNNGVRKHGVVTTAYPLEAFVPPEGTLGMPEVICDRCDSCGGCADVCPTGAITVSEGSIGIDLGRCIFCGECARTCPKEAFVMSREFELASRHRNELEVVYNVK